MTAEKEQAWETRVERRTRKRTNKAADKTETRGPKEAGQDACKDSVAGGSPRVQSVKTRLSLTFGRPLTLPCATFAPSRVDEGCCLALVCEEISISSRSHSRAESWRGRRAGPSERSSCAPVLVLAGRFTSPGPRQVGALEPLMLTCMGADVDAIRSTGLRTGQMKSEYGRRLGWWCSF